uniref:Evolutionarily conserved signaling intermediate in Toll pathway, mitochondrial n=1 Tax=Strigamia maritima TaxID=126957 RepID=T1J3B0_STRMM
MNLGLRKVAFNISTKFNVTVRNFSHIHLNKCHPQLKHCLRTSTSARNDQCMKIHTSCQRLAKQQSDSEQKTLVIRGTYFESIKDKNRKTFQDAIKIFKNRGRRGYVEFIYAAMAHMEEFGVQRDLETYKQLMDVFPKGVLIPRGPWEVEFMHYPKQQYCAIDLLDDMEMNGVMPDRDMKDIILAAFGNKSFPIRKFMRMMYWMPKFKNLSPWPIPFPLPEAPIELAKIAMRRISSVDLETELNVFQTKDLEDSIDDTWIVSVQSPAQKELVADCKENIPVYVEGVFLVCLKYRMINYFILRADAKPAPTFITKEELDDVSDIPVFWGTEEPKPASLCVIPSIHEQDDGTILAMCATGTSSRDSVLSWIRFLQNENPRLAKIPILFKLRAPSTDLVIKEDEDDESKPKWKPAVNQGPELIM